LLSPATLEEAGRPKKVATNQERCPAPAGVPASPVHVVSFRDDDAVLLCSASPDRRERHVWAAGRSLCHSGLTVAVEPHRPPPVENEADTEPLHAVYALRVFDACVTREPFWQA